MNVAGRLRQIDDEPDPVPELLLRTLIDEVRMLIDEIRLERQGRASPLSRADRVTLGTLLPVVGAIFGPEMFTAREVVKHEAPGLQLVTVGLNAKRLGKLLSRVAGQPVDGYLVTREGDEAGVGLWAVREVPGFSGCQTPVVPSRRDARR